MNVLMPQLGETVSEGTIAAWHKQAGDAVEKGPGHDQHQEIRQQFERGHRLAVDFRVRENTDDVVARIGEA